MENQAKLKPNKLGMSKPYGVEITIKNKILIKYILEIVEIDCNLDNLHILSANFHYIYK